MEKIVFLGMGGTITGVADSPLDNTAYRVAQVGVEQLVGVELARNEILSAYELVFEEVAHIDSKDLDFEHLMVLAQAVQKYLVQSEVRGVVITHGTDTLEEAAYFLWRFLPADLLSIKPVVMTGAMRPASSAFADGPQNIFDATQVVCSPNARGVTVVFAGIVHSALHVEKVHPYRLDAFDSGEFSPFGYVEDGRVRWVQQPCHINSASFLPALYDGVKITFPRVEIVMNYVGANGFTVRAWSAALAHDDAPVRGIIVAGTGNGTVHHDLENALRQAQAQGIRVVRATRCAFGRTLRGTSSGSDVFLSANGLSPVKARIALASEVLQQEIGCIASANSLPKNL